ncbi:ATPase, T2SS/T4P/T4SS family [Zhongshania sp.]|jgi:twitching motility protein PilU|uniref:ATPase, T2SS/T4P/T4SS family n=1 Tax=Zhongshania sp. TaxID=1971902 RepID=UPI0039E44947
MNLAYHIPRVGRFRITISKQRDEISLVTRNIVTDIPNVDTLGLSPILEDVIMTNRGLVLFVGATGSGKSTSLAAVIDHRNTNSSGHIITIEDPIEFLHKHKRNIINQREIGMDTRSFQQALKTP